MIRSAYAHSMGLLLQLQGDAHGVVVAGNNLDDSLTGHAQLVDHTR